MTEPAGVTPGTSTPRTLTWNIKPTGNLTYFTASDGANMLFMHINLDAYLR